MKRRAFTLIELLVVAAVMAILLGLLLPSLGRARSAAKLAECLSNTRQLVIAVGAYALDHRGRAVPGAPGIAATNLVRWHGVRATAGEAFDPRGGAIAPYLDGAGASAAIRACPEFAPVMAVLAARSAGFERACGGYGYNNAFLGVDRRQSSSGVWTIVTDALGAPAARFRSPARTIAFADAALAADELIEYSFAEPCFWPDFPGARPDPSLHFRHDGLAAVAWLDGHGSNERRSYTAASGIYGADPEALGTGWFGDAADNAMFDYE